MRGFREPSQDPVYKEVLDLSLCVGSDLTPTPRASPRPPRTVHPAEL